MASLRGDLVDFASLLQMIHFFCKVIDVFIQECHALLMQFLAGLETLVRRRPESLLLLMAQVALVAALVVDCAISQMLVL